MFKTEAETETEAVVFRTTFSSSFKNLVRQMDNRRGFQKLPLTGQQESHAALDTTVINMKYTVF